MQRERQTGHIAMLTALPTTQQQKTGAIARNIVHGERQLIQPVFTGSGLGGDRSTEGTARHHASCFSRG